MLWVVSPLQILLGWSCVFGRESDFIKYRLSFGTHCLLPWFHFLAALMLSLCNCPYENQVHPNKCVYLLPWGEWFSLEEYRDLTIAKTGSDSWVICRNIIIALADCPKNHSLYTNCICCLHSWWVQEALPNGHWVLWGKVSAAFQGEWYFSKPEEKVKDITHGLRFLRPNKPGSPTLLPQKGLFPHIIFFSLSLPILNLDEHIWISEGH